MSCGEREKAAEMANMPEPWALSGRCIKPNCPETCACERAISSDDDAAMLVADLLEEVRDGHGGVYEDGEHPTVDRARAFLLSRTGNHGRTSEFWHTPEPWYASNEDGNWRVMAADENGGYTLADMCCDDQEANARRIVACVNACVGMDTELLEIFNWSTQRLKITEAIVDRNDLMVAIENLIRVKGRHHTEIAFKRLVEVYDSVKGQPA